MIGGRSWIFLRRQENRKVLAWLGSGVALVATAGWAVFVYFHDNSGGARADCTVTAESSVVACDGGVQADGDISIGDTN